MSTVFKGSGCALITPFTNTGVNYGELDRLVEFQVENGTDAIIACGTTGETVSVSLSGGGFAAEGRFAASGKELAVRSEGPIAYDGQRYRGGSC